MKKNFIFLFVFNLFTSRLSSQDLPLPQIVKPKIVHEDCGTDSIHKKLMATDSVYRKKNEDFEKLMLAKKKQLKNVTKIPVVIHIMNTGDSIGKGINLTDEQVKQGLANINLTFKETVMNSSDSAETIIEFVLPEKDKNKINGIIRYDLSKNTKYKKYGVALNLKKGIKNEKLKSICKRDSSGLVDIYIVNKINNENCVKNDGTYTTGFSFFDSSNNSRKNETVLLACVFLDLKNTLFTKELNQGLKLYLLNKKENTSANKENSQIQFVQYFFQTETVLSTK